MTGPSSSDAGGEHGKKFAFDRATLPESAAGLPRGENRPRLLALFWVFFTMGLTAFGPAMMAEARKHIVRRTGWLKEEEFLDGLALAQFLPGATFVTLTVFMGYRIRRFAGAAVSVVAFLLPPTAVMILLSYLYFRFSGLPLVAVASRGLAAAVVALIANATLDLGLSIIKDWRTAAIAAVAVIVAWFDPNVFLILLLSAALGIALITPWRRRTDGPGMSRAGAGLPLPRGDARTTHPARLTSSYWRELAITSAVFAALAGLSAIHPVLLALEGVFFRIGLLVFGNGFTMIPLIQQEVVAVHHWLTLEQFTVGVGLGQITPGPVVITATFVGYGVAGLWGALAATAGVFAPCFLLVILLMPVYTTIKENRWVRAIFKGVLASFVGLMVVVAVGMGRRSLTDLTSVGLSVASFAVLRLSKIGVLWVVLGGVAVYLVIEQLFGIP